jgi:myosin heavy subunit
MKPQSLQDAIKAAAAKKRSKVEQGGWREPEVKAHKVTAEEFQAAKSGGCGVGGRPSASSDASDGIAMTVIPNISASIGVSAQASSDILRKIEMERREFLKEKQEILNEMRANSREMTETQSNYASLRRNVALLESKVEKLEMENQTLREKVHTGVSSSKNHQSSSKINTTDLDLEKLEARVERLESENRKLKERIVSGGGRDEIDRLNFKLEKLEDRTTRLGDKIAAIERLEEETRGLQEKLSSISAMPSSLLTARTDASIPVTPKSPTLSKTSHAPSSPATPSKPPVATNSLASKSPSPTKAIKKTKSSSSLASSSLDVRSGGTPIFKIFSAEKLSKHQGKFVRRAVQRCSCALHRRNDISKLMFFHPVESLTRGCWSRLCWRSKQPETKRSRRTCPTRTPPSACTRGRP